MFQRKKASLAKFKSALNYNSLPYSVHVPVNNWLQSSYIVDMKKLDTCRSLCFGVISHIGHVDDEVEGH